MHEQLTCPVAVLSSEKIICTTAMRLPTSMAPLCKQSGRKFPAAHLIIENIHFSALHTSFIVLVSLKLMITVLLDELQAILQE